MKTLQELRAEVDKIDKLIIEQLANRDLLSSKIGLLKFQQKQKVHDPIREKALKTHHAALAKKQALDAIFIERLFKIILRHSKKIQESKKGSVP